ncbi:MAG: hypothetical protein ACRDP8_24675 [Actinopolymorphaceae bacterium]
MTADRGSDQDRDRDRPITRDQGDGHGVETGVEIIDTGLVDWVFEGSLAARFGYTQGDLGILARLLCRPCPGCRAEPGAWCRTPNGRELVGLDVQHTARRLRPDHVTPRRCADVREGERSAADDAEPQRPADGVPG